MANDKQELVCVECGKRYDPESWDPMGGDCPVVRDEETGEVIAPDEGWGD